MLDTDDLMARLAGLADMTRALKRAPQELTPPLDDSALAALEARLGVSLPDDYRQFVSRVAAGGAGPDYGLLDPGTAMPSELPQVTATVTTVSGEQFSASTGSRPPIERTPRADLPFLVPSGWRPVNDKGEAQPLANPPDSHIYDGCVQLTEIGCGYFRFLVLTGPHRGEVWTDYTAGNGAIAHYAPDFGSFYGEWLHGSLSAAVVELSRKGLAPELVRRWRHVVDRGTAPNDELGRAEVAWHLGEADAARTALERGRARGASPKWVDMVEARVYAQALADAEHADPARFTGLVAHPIPAVRLRLAANPHLDLATLERLTEEASPRLWNVAAKHPAADAALLDRLAERAGASDPASLLVLERIARHPAVSMERLRTLAARVLEGRALFAQIVGRGVAASPRLPLELARELGAHPEPTVRHAVALFSQAPELLAALAADSHAGVRAAVATNEATPAGTLEVLAAERSDLLRAALCENPNLPEPLVLRLLDESSYLAYCGLMRNPSLRGTVADLVRSHFWALDTFRFAFDGDPQMLAARARRLDAVADVVERGDVSHAAWPLDLPLPPPTSALAVTYTLASHPLLEARHLELLAGEEYAYTRAKVARQPMTPVEVLVKLAADPVAMVRGPALERVPLAVALAHLTDKAEEARSGIAARHDLPADVVERLSRDPVNYVRRAVAWNPAVAPEILARLASDSDMQVRWGAAVNTKLPYELRVQLAKDLDAKVAKSASFYLRKAN